ncbi:MAG: hypothetical protein ACLUNO_03115 [Oscillospiraceae bacterium]
MTGFVTGNGKTYYYADGVRAKGFDEDRRGLLLLQRRQRQDVQGRQHVGACQQLRR